ncbi:unnamed protein product [Durusdinium trenchii]|uniref:Uncharacterized protein n=1 Tax=Durusdinium trenchii TaxID=1381693 RepID=A0ABP0MUV0_9DINO
MALIAKGEDAPQMAYVTWGTQDDVTGPGSYLHAGLWGLARTIRMEERTMKLRCFDLDSTHLQPEAAAKALVDALGTLLGMGAGASESELSLRGEQFKVSRLSRSPVQVRKPMRLQMSSRGSLSNLRPVPQVVRPQPGPGQVELRIRAIGLNFRDVLNVMGMYPGDPGNPGGDCAGTVCSIAQGEKEVAQLRPGHDVFGIAWGCLQTYACTEALLLAPKPKAWSFEQMAAWSVTFATTEEAFQELAPLKKGERVLIHAATGGVGLVAVQFAQRVGATIFATAGSPGKVKHLQDLGVKYITSSRDAKAFEEDMKRFMKEDGADAAGGLDVVLNSLSHDDYIPKSLGFLRKGGRFMEIGKRLIWSHEQMQQERPDVQYEKIAMDWVMEHQPERYNVLMRRLVSQIEKGWWKEVPLTCYEGLNSGIDAMRYLQRAQQIGKVVLTQPSRMQLKEDGRYVLSGGVGALGLVTTQMLAEEGAKSVVLLSRRGVVGDDLKSMWEKLQDFDLELQVKPCDVASFSHVQEMVMSLDNSYRMRGLIHLAAVLDDATLPKLTRRHLEKAYGAKVFGARHLRLCLSKAQPLDFSMLFSSTSALLGSPGQGNYSAANMALDAHARYWKALGETVVAVQWGPWREVGMAANKGTVQRLKSQGLGSIGNTVGMAALAGALGSASPVVAACPVHWGQYLKQFGKAVPPFYSRFRREAASASPAGPTGGRALALGARAAPAVSADQVQSMVLAVAGEVTGSVVAAQEPLMEAGMDSLSAVEFRNRLSNELPGIKLPNTLIFDYPTVSAISMFAASQLSASPAQAQPQAAGISAQEVEAVVLAIAGEVTGHAVDAQEPLMDSGMDSLAAVEFRNRLSNELQGVKLPNTLIFDYPTVSAISNFAASQVGATSGSAAAFAAVQGGFAGPSAGQAASISGMAATLPGRRDEGFWEDLLEKKDSVVEIPFTRWDLEMYYSPDPDAPGKTYAKHGGFIEGAELFDPSCFGLSAAEASSIDPQQRLLLEAAHTAFTAAGRDKDQLMGAEVGVFVGQCQYDWFVMVSVGDKFNPYTGTGISASISANRTSYIFGIKGPSVTCDTACSSSLVAADAALSSLRRGTAEAALAAGTNLILGTGPYISFSKAKMLSEDGRCFTFDASANGYARGEGVGAALLSLDDAGAVAVRASLAGAAANQDGRSASLTAPNGPSQQAVIRRALLEASTDSKDVGLIECHGTGTALGDPIEVDALKGVLGENRTDPLVLGAAKTNIAHLEGSAGIAGFLKSVHMLEKRQAPPNLHFQSLNPHIDMEDFPAVIPTELQELPSGTLASGLSSFGFGGTNAHLTFVAAPKPAAPPETAIAFRHASFPWRETAYRCLRRKIMEGRDTHFECTIKSDLFKVCAEHVAFGEIVVPGVVYVEHAMEAVKTIVGKEGYLKDLAMTWPLVIPKNADEPTATTVFLRFCQMGDKFEMRSLREGNDEMITHCEGRIGRGLAEPAQLNLEELREMCTEEVDPKDVYAAIHKGGLWLGPRFQVCKQMQRMRTGPSGEGGDRHVLCLLEHSPESQPNQGFYMHPATLDGTIHVLGATMVGWEAPLKIFSGMGRVQSHVHRNFSRDEQYYVHLDLKTFSEQEQVFDSTVSTLEGEVLFKGTDVAFRKVTPEQIKKAMESQMAEDDQKIYEVVWTEVKGKGEAEAAEVAGRCLVLAAENSKESEILAELPNAEVSGISEEALEAIEDGGLEGVAQVISAVGLSQAEPLEALAHALRLMKALVKMPPSSELPELVFLTNSAVSVLPNDLTSLPVMAPLWGLARALRAERPDLKVEVLDLALSEVELPALLPLLRQDPELAVREGRRLAPRLADATAAMPEVSPASFEGCHLLSGGTGALGLVFGAWLAEKGARHLALMSRSGRVTDESLLGLFEKVQKLADVHVLKGDIAKKEDVKTVMQQANKLGKLKGLWHAAGILDDHLMADLQQEHLQNVLLPKMDGTLHLHNHAKEMKLELSHFVLFSSVAAMLGTAGQGNYCAANAFLDAFAAYRRQHDLPAVSVQWGPWAEVGMAARAGTSESVVLRIALQEGLQAMDNILGAQATSHLGAYVGVARIKWRSFLAQMPRLPSFLENFQQYAPKDAKKGGLVAKGAAPSRDLVRIGIENVLKEVLGDDSLEDFSSPLMDMGLDSLAAVEFRNRVQASFEGVRLSSTVMFDYPTVADLTDFILSQFAPDDDADGAVLGGDLSAAREPLSMLGLAGRYPGMSAQNDVSEFWSFLLSGQDPICEIPIERFDVDELFEEDRGVPGKVYVREGGFIPGVEEFDAAFFGIAEPEARSMDTHQRLQTETAYESFYNSGFTKETLANVECGVFMGCCTLTGITVDYEDIGPFTNIGSGLSGMSGRISHALGLRGPCFTIDTACSSTLVAMDCAVQASRLGRQELACVAGTNLQLRTDMWVGFCKMTGLAGDGRCKTFDQSADGFGRSEGSGSVILRLKAAANAKGESGLTLTRGSCVNQDGRSATITAPSGPAQQRALQNSLRDSELSALEVSLVECHGTGTALGDPIEVGAQEKIYGKDRADQDQLILAAAKSVIAHLEGAAGVAGITKLVKMLEHKMVPPNLHLKKLNPNIDLSNFACCIPDKVMDWAVTGSRCAGVSSFGFSGTNSHVNLQEAPTEELQATLQQLGERPVMSWSRSDLSYKDWAKQLWWGISWQPLPASTATVNEEWLVLGGGSLVKDAAEKVLPKATVLGMECLASTEKVDELLAKPYAGLIFAEALKAEDPTLQGPTLASLLRLVQGLALKSSTKLLLLTSGAQSAVGGAVGRGLLGAGVWGFARSVRLEVPHVQLKIVDLPADQSLAELLPTELCPAWASDEDVAAQQAEIAYINGERCAPRLRTTPVPAGSKRLEPDGSCLISGGFGGLGLSIAQEFLQMGAKTLILVSRSGRVAAGDAQLQEMFDALSASGDVTVHAWSCDVADGVKTKEMLKKAKALDVPLRNVVHAAGIIDFCEVGKLTVEGMNSVFKPKVSGAWNLHSGIDAQDAKEMHSFVLFSSVSALIGLSSGITYSASNAYLDGLSLWRRFEQLPCSSLQWGPVAELGMAAKGEAHGASDSALKLISPKHVRNAFQRVLAKPSLPSSLLFARADWSRFMQQVGTVVPVLVESQARGSAGAPGGGALEALQGLSPDALQGKLLSIVLDVAQGVLGEQLEEDAPLMESGLDSLSAVDFRNQVAKQLPGLKLPNTLMFDYPSPQAIAKYATAQLAPAAAAPTAAPARAPLVGAAERGPLAVLSSACRFPAGGDDPDVFWTALVQKTDGVSEIPYDRWDVDEYFDPSPNAVGRMYVRHAAFIQNADCFDAMLFGISGAEAASMDPQQRLLLEIVQEAFSASKGLLAVGGDSSPLTNKDIGSFVGECNNDWGHFKNLETEKMNPFSGTGGSMSISSNRLAYVFGFRGPSVTSDTACSSSLVALDTACANIGRNRCSASVSAGVNMNLLPGPFVACCQAKMLSEGGRCKTFDASADGYSRGEGAGTILIRRLSELAEHGLCAISGTAANQDGRSSSLTAPNGPAQQEVIWTAWQEAGETPGTADFIETHGTGTGLGDPIEVGALCSTFGVQRSSSLYVGAVKTNVSHLEGAAGIAGLLKAITAMQHHQVPPNLHLAKLNPHIDVEEVDMVFPTESMVQLSQETLKSFGLSSFGFGGTNTHVSGRAADTEAVATAPAQEKIVFNRQRFGWSQTKHPLSVQPRRGDGGVMVFAAPIKGKVLQLLSHHIIYGEIVVPGATYIEMVIATSAFRLDMAGKKFALENIGFQNPLVLRPSNDDKVNPELNPGVDLYLQIQENTGRWSMSSVEHGTSDVINTHAEGSVSFLGPKATSSAAELRQLPLEEIRGRCPEEVEDARMYVPFANIGLPLQPRFRTVRTIKRSEDVCVP